MSNKKTFIKFSSMFIDVSEIAGVHIELNHRNFVDYHLVIILRGGYAHTTPALSKEQAYESHSKVIAQLTSQSGADGAAVVDVEPAKVK